MFNVYTIKGTYAWGFCFIMLTYENVEVTQLTTISQAYFCATCFLFLYVLVIASDSSKSEDSESTQGTKK